MGRKPAKTQHVKRNIASTAARPTSSTLADLQEQVSALTLELTEARKQLAGALAEHTATSEVLQIISSSPGELEPVFQAILANATQICGAKFGTLYLYDGDAFHATAFHNAPPAFIEASSQSDKPHWV